MTDPVLPGAPESPTGEFAGRRVVVTGAGSGIGLATVRLAVARGASVLGAARSEVSLAAIAAAGAEPLAVDVSVTADLTRLVAAAGGRCDHLVTSHGETMGQPIDRVTGADFDRSVSVNLRSVFFLLQAFAPVLPDHGSIVTVASTAAKTGAIPEVAVYAAAKAGVLSLTRSFASAHAARGMRVNCVVPGIIDTPMQRRFLELNAPLRHMSVAALDAERLAATPMRRAGTPDEAAEVILFLLSARAGYLTGQAINVAGGFVTW